MEPTNSSSAIKWTIGIIVVVILALAAYFGFRKSAPAAADSTVGANQAGDQSTAYIVVSDQYPGTSVNVSSATLPQGGWVEIHKDDNGQPGAIIGSAWMDPGTGPVTVNVSSPIIDGGVYYAMLHSDDGDKAFDATKDMPIKDQNGALIMQMFKGSAAAGNNTKG